MELKQIFGGVVGIILKRFDWTSVELKLKREPKYLTLVRVLIEPVWNWNCFWWTTSWNRNTSFWLNQCGIETRIEPERGWMLVKSFDWTSVELKHTSNLIGLIYLSYVLIEPVWNWNKNIKKIFLQEYYVLIEPVWNWNVPTPSLIVPVSCFDWTSVELKLVTFCWCCSNNIVLIEPVWNWNK